MPRNTTTIAILVLSAAAVTAATVTVSAAGQEVYHVGVARSDITPEYPIRLSGFGSRRAESEGITQRIWAKALAVSVADEPPLVLLAIDSLGVRMPMVDEVAACLR
ncbi:MAG: hypothetical protein FJ276_06160, partial [Planctomycetes bacterium]|nr:hypothetical protein [Planctomycetota bacterium]